MDNKQIKDKIKLELLIDEYIKKEKNPEATELKKEFIMDLINKEMEFIGVFHYYYEIIRYNDKNNE